jgi:glycosyltransferase involved in cell wall biosynthesis
MNILFVVDEYPFPSRNGVTLPVSNFMKLFAAKGFRVDLLLLNISDSNTFDCRRFKGVTTAFAQLSLKRTRRLVGLGLELMGKEALFEAWSPMNGLVGDRLLEHYDLVWASPIRSYGLWLKFSSSLNISTSKLVAAINDSYSLTLKELSKRKLRWFGRWIYHFRSLAMYGIEKKLLKKADFVAVQSRREIDFFREMFEEGDTPDFIELKNGVSANLFQDRPVAVCDLLFVGSLDAFYRPTLDWFIREVYSKMPVPRPSFSVVGKGATDEDIRKFAEFSINYLPFVENIEDVYLTSKILVAPIFKGYGTINKVIEAMAAGCVVVGDHTAFNGIEGFAASRDGLVAESPGEFLGCIQTVLADSRWAKEIGESARNLMLKDFSWDSRLHAVLSRLNIL